MADLSRHERGQLVLVTAVSIAALLVLVAVLLSSVVYTENVATRDVTADDARAAQLHRVAAVEAVDGITERANRDGASPDEFRANVSAWSDLQARHAAITGASIDVTVNSMSEERTVSQPSSQPFTDDSGNSSWVLFSNATGVNRWQLTVEADSLVTPASTGTVNDLETSGAFHAVVTNGSSTWRAFVYRNGTDVEVRVDENGTLSDPCAVAPAADGNVTVDPVARTVGTESCPALGFETTVESPFTISHEEGANATGTYSLVVPYISDVRIDVTYTTGGLHYVARNVSVDAEVGS